jgi:hypothetical protein
MKQYDWTGINVLYYYEKNTGKIVGQCHMITLTQIWIGKVWVDPVMEKSLGQFISLEHVKKAVEQYWLSESMTLIE